MSKNKPTPYLNSIKSYIKKTKSFVQRPEGFFLVFSVFFGFIFVFLTPPMRVYDERPHFFQAYAVSNFDFIPDKYEYNGRYHYGAELPKSVFVAGELFIANTAGNSDVKFDKHLFKAYINQPLQPTVTDHRESGTGYSPIAYIPQAIGITIGKIFNSSPLIMIWLGRLTNLIAWVGIVYFAIRILPFGKWALAILALNPMAVFLSASLSADVMTTALIFLFFSLVGSVFGKSKPLSKSKLALIFSTLGLMVLTKPTNALFALLLFAIPWRNLKTKRNYILICLGGIAIAVITAFLWNHLVAEANQFTSQMQSVGRVVSAPEQLAGIIHSPLGYVKTIFLNYILIPSGYPGDFVLMSSIGVLGWGETNIPLWTIILYVICLFFSLLYASGRGELLTKSQKAILASVFVLFFVGNITAMYLYLNGIGYSIIQGVQGRYFIPGAILITGLFAARKKILVADKELFVITLGLLMIVVLGMTALKILFRYYG